MQIQLTSINRGLNKDTKQLQIIGKHENGTFIGCKMKLEEWAHMTRYPSRWCAFFLRVAPLKLSSVNKHGCFVYTVFASKKLVSEKKSSFCIETTWFRFVISEVISATALTIAYIRPNRLGDCVVHRHAAHLHRLY